MNKRLAIHDLGTGEPTLCIEDEETSTCTILAVFEAENFEQANKLSFWLDTHHVEARSMGEALS